MSAEWIKEVIDVHPLLAPFVFILVRSLGILIPPIPGFVLDLAGLAVFGWVLGFIYGTSGVMLGTMTAFFIGRTWGIKFISRFYSLEKLRGWESSLSDRQKFWGFLSLRLASNPLFDIISYAAGFTGISVWKYFLATLLGTVPQMFVFYYLGGIVISEGWSYILAFVTAIALWILILKKRRG
jgi:uncharacterized membrane protein YdjX (TVP38/TMEM64 family)